MPSATHHLHIDFFFDLFGNVIMIRTPSAEGRAVYVRTGPSFWKKRVHFLPEEAKLVADWKAVSAQQEALNAARRQEAVR